MSNKLLQPFKGQGPPSLSSCTSTPHLGDLHFGDNIEQPQVALVLVVSCRLCSEEKHRYSDLAYLPNLPSRQVSQAMYSIQVSSSRAMPSVDSCTRWLPSSFDRLISRLFIDGINMRQVRIIALDIGGQRPNIVNRHPLKCLITCLVFWEVYCIVKTSKEFASCRQSSTIPLFHSGKVWPHIRYIIIQYSWIVG